MLRYLLLCCICLFATGTLAADNTLDNTVTPQTVLARDTVTGPVIIDVRSSFEYWRGHVPGAIHIPHDDIAARSDELAQYRQRGIVLYCEVGGRASAAAAALQQAGFDNLKQLQGHMRGWRANDLPIE